jgi:DNA helicase-2/ATP-dependent DNA helicase PcrA
VYKFQGADTSNIARFKKLYTDVTTIVLVENYRSTQEVLTVAREVITQGKNRLERHDPTLRKDLRANNKKISKGSIGMYGFHSDVEEYSFVAEQVQALIEKGEKKEEIVVIAREHKQLRAILPYLDALSIPYTYTREENVFDEQHVKELVILCRFLSAMLDERGDADHLLPEILSFPFWGLDRITVWEIAEYAKREHCSWLAAMKDSTGEKVRLIAHFLIELSVLAKTTPLEIILDTLIGSRDVPLVSDDEHDDLYEVLAPIRVDVDYSSPYKEYYFGKEVYAKNPSSYIHFLSSLRVFVKALREYKDGEILYTRDVGPFVDMHLAYNIALINNTPFAHNEESITLLTSHGAKGLEFGNVFIISAHDDIWASGSKSAKLRFPINLPLAQSPDDEDDFIRLFYVALTRARHSITITYHDQMFRVLQHESLSSYVQDQEVVKTKELLALGLKVHHAPPFANNEKALLKKVLEGYQLSPTHLNNFLNIIDGGPMKFLEQNLLRFPQAKHASSVYGTAVHKALEDMYKSYKEKGTVPALSFVTNSFEKELRRGRLMGYEEEKMCARGVEMLARYYPEEKKRLPDIVYAELDFKRQGVVVDGAHITGKIDRVIARKEGGWTVMDIKTGKPLLRWDKGTSIHEDMKIRNYKYQLMMYKMLIEHSRDYRRESVDRGVLMFVEEDDGDVTTSLELVFSQISGDEYSRFQKLVSVVYDKIINLDFPDTSTYELSRKGVEQFEEDLLSGAV